MTDREAFCYQLATLPILRADAVVILCGQDGEERTKFGVGQFATGVAPYLVLSGGLHDPPRVWGAKELAAKAMGMGVSPANIVVESESQNTREQAVNVLAMCEERNWKRLLLVASPYHVPRAYLTFLAVLLEQGKSDDIHLLPVPASHLNWHEPPKGMEQTRAELLDVEFLKIAAYKPEHVASYADGLVYMASWEGR
jgi:uncharacterized SAM-binding protein YcdF (DUF218 family)